MNYLEEIQKINKDYQKAKLVIMSCNYTTQLETAIQYSTSLVRYHCNRLGIPKKYDKPLQWFFFEKEKKQKNKIIGYIDLCVADLQDLVEIKRTEVIELQPYFVGYGAEYKRFQSIKESIKKWEDKKKKENLEYVHRTIECEELQVD